MPTLIRDKKSCVGCWPYGHSVKEATPVPKYANLIIHGIVC
jgi:hypothetical protein